MRRDWKEGKIEEGIKRKKSSSQRTRGLSENKARETIKTNEEGPKVHANKEK